MRETVQLFDEISSRLRVAGDLAEHRASLG